MKRLLLAASASLMSAAMLMVLLSTSTFGGHPQAPPSQTINDNLPNPFNEPVENWVVFPDGRKLGATIGLSYDSKGHLWGPLTGAKWHHV